TSVIVATATASWSTPERMSRQALSRTVLRQTGCEITAIEQFNQPGAKLPPSAVRRMADTWDAHRACRDPPDRDDGPPAGELRGALPVRVLVEGLADASAGELVHESLGRYDDRSVGELGATGLRGRTSCAADPQNLIWVIPAEEGAMQDEVVVVVAGGTGLPT